jgi:hypothetical protein
MYHSRVVNGKVTRLTCKASAMVSCVMTDLSIHDRVISLCEMHCVAKHTVSDALSTFATSRFTLTRSMWIHSIVQHTASSLACLCRVRTVSTASNDFTARTAALS